MKTQNSVISLVRHFTMATILSTFLTTQFMSRMCEAQTGDQAPKLSAAAVEGVVEYQLKNGCRLVLYRDPSSQSITVNMTVLVGSRHEGYGESGMAHLLEHMLFKGTPLHKNIKEELKQRGATDMNGTTWYDRTNFYETLPATEDNLAWAIQMEADRLTNCYIKGEDLASEMTVVRSEFEISENSPEQILMQRMSANAFEWHNYGKAVIGSRVDIERVPLNSLRAFYAKYYRPDNVVVFVTGNFDEKNAIGLAEKYFGGIEVPKSELQPTYTQEPVQDGERNVFLRRVGGAALLGHLYHIPSVSHPDYAAVKVLARILGTNPNGVLYRQFVKTNKASQVSADAMECHDPGILLLMVTPKDSDVNESNVMALAADVAQVVESGLQAQINDDTVELAKATLGKEFEDALLNSKALASTLSDYSAYGDWRLFFLTRDRIASVSTSDIQRVAESYLRTSNRTTGIYLPTEAPKRSAVPQTENIAKSLRDYVSPRAALAVERDYKPTPSELHARITKGTLDSGVTYSILPKSTRGDLFHLKLTLNFGTPENFRSREAMVAAGLLGACMQLGTASHSREELDRLMSKYKTQIQIESQPGSVTISLEGRKEFFNETMDLVYELLRKPSFSEEEFGLLKSSHLTELMKLKNDPQMMAQYAASRALSPVEKNDHQYVPTIPEMFTEFRKSKIGHVKELYSLLSGKRGQVSLVGAFDQAPAIERLNQLLAGWESVAHFKRLENVHHKVPASLIELRAKDQASAFYMRASNIKANITDPDWEALTSAADILGGESLSSRLARNVRDEKGLSYSVGCQFQADDFDSAGQFMVVAAMNPQNKDAVSDAIRGTVDDVLKNGFSEDELKASIETYVKKIETYLSEDAMLCELVHLFQRRGTDMEFLAGRLDRVRALTIEQVNAAAKRLLECDAVTVVVGDFAVPEVPAKSSTESN